MKPKRVAIYTRISTAEQKADLQTDELTDIRSMAQVDDGGHLQRHDQRQQGQTSCIGQVAGRCPSR
jgi:predicted site-specific integrase-resolvase